MPDVLKQQLARRIASERMLVVVGTGVSLASTGGETLASWKGLIGNGVDRCVDLKLKDAAWGDQYKKLLESDLEDLLGVAEQVSRRLGWRPTEPCGGDWSGWLRETVGALRVKKRDLIKAIRDLGTPIATLNYDNLLTEATGRPPLTWQQAAQWLPVLEGRDEAILHLHGHWRQHSSVVLGIRSYDAVLGEGLAQHMQRALATFQSLVFIGCSGTLVDPNFGALLEWLRHELGDSEHSHYLLVREGEALPVPEPQLREARIVPLRYGRTHSDLLPYLAGLSRKGSGKSGGEIRTRIGGGSPPSPARHNLPTSNPDFVGREEPLKGLRHLLTEGKGPAVITQVITGLGGIGKTQTALAYCYRHLADYDLIWWLHAETPATLAVDYGTLARPLGLDPGTADQEKMAAAIRERLSTLPSWLLVFDNVEDPTLPRAWLPTTGGGHALITSRRTDWRGIARVLPLEAMREYEALQLLTGSQDPGLIPGAELARAKALIQDLGYLPLALAQARAYMAETGRSFGSYQKLLRASQSVTLAKRLVSRDFTLSFASVWQTSVDAAASACPAARPLLELLAFFAAEPLPADVLAADPSLLPSGLQGERARNAAIGALHRYSLIRAEGGSITVHRLVQAVARDALDEATTKVRAETAVRLVNAALPHLPQEHANWPTMASLLPHALAATEAAERLTAALEVTATVLNQTAVYHQARAAWAEAEPLLERAIAIGEKTLGPEHPDLATRLNNLAQLYQDTGRHAEAEPLYERALAIGEKTLGPEHPTLAAQLNNLASLYHDTGRLAEAEPLYERALAIGEKTLGPEHPTLAVQLNNLTLLYQDTGRHAEAEPLMQRARAIDEKALGPDHPAVARDLNNLATLYQDTGRHAEAEPLMQRAVAILVKALPAGHPNLVTVRSNYAALLDQLGRTEEATKLRAQAPAATA